MAIVKPQDDTNPRPMEKPSATMIETQPSETETTGGWPNEAGVRISNFRIPPSQFG